MTKALLVIDMKKEFSPGGKLPLWNTEITLDNVKQAIHKASEKNIQPILIRHLMPSGQAPFFEKDSEGVEIHPEILLAAPDTPVIEKNFAYGF